MSKVRTITATLLVASLASGCGVVSQVNNARAGYQAVSAYSTAKAMMGAQPAFENASAFSVTANLMPRDEEDAALIEQTFTQLAIEQTQATAKELGLDLAYCEMRCPSDTVRIQFKERGREGFAEKFALGDKIGGDLYLMQSGEVIEQSPLDMAEDYAKMAQILNGAINIRLVKTAQSDLRQAFEAGEISDRELSRRSEIMMERLNNQGKLDGPLIELLKDKA